MSVRRLWPLVLSLATFACKDERDAVVSVEIIDRSPPVADPTLKLDPVKARSLLESKVARLPNFVFRPSAKDGPRHQLTAILALSIERSARPNDAGVVPADSVFRGIALDLSLNRLQSKTSDRHEATIVYGRNAPLFEPLDAVLEEALDRGLTILAADLSLARASNTEVVAAIDGPDLEIASRAMDRSAERKISDAVPAIVRRVQDDTLPAALRVRGIGALVAIRDPRAVPGLIALTRGRTPAFNTQIVFGVAEIGGKEAEAWLFTVSSGHPDPELRRSATDALTELEARKRREVSKAPR